MRRAEIMRLAFCDADEPYVVPVCFAYQDGVIFVHSAKEGRKLEIIRRSGKVCFEVDTYKIVRKDVPCKWTIDYTSVIGLGDASLIEDVEEEEEGPRRDHDPLWRGGALRILRGGAGEDAHHQHRRPVHDLQALPLVSLAGWAGQMARQQAVYTSGSNRCHRGESRWKNPRSTL